MIMIDGKKAIDGPAIGLYEMDKMQMLSSFFSDLNEIKNTGKEQLPQLVRYWRPIGHAERKVVLWSCQRIVYPRQRRNY